MHNHYHTKQPNYKKAQSSQLFQDETIAGFGSISTKSSEIYSKSSQAVKKGIAIKNTLVLRFTCYCRTEVTIILYYTFYLTIVTNNANF